MSWPHGWSPRWWLPAAAFAVRDVKSARYVFAMPAVAWEDPRSIAAMLGMAQRPGLDARRPPVQKGPFARSLSSPLCLTRDTGVMTDVTIRELRNKGGEVVERASRGEQITITRAGKPVASLRPLDMNALAADVLLARWRRLPPVDPAGLRADLDDILGAEL